MIELRPQRLTAAAFAPYGDVVASADSAAEEMNAESFERFDDLCQVEAHAGRVAISIARCRIVTELPHQFAMVERHPHGSQSFVPLTPCRMMVVVAPAGAAPKANDLRAFVSNGRQGINYHRGTWHMPLIAFDENQEFLIIDRVGDSPNCDQHDLDQPVTLLDDG
ncbi:MAG: ureidoglycolate lyase [Woeseiaceae bacterium]